MRDQFVADVNDFGKYGLLRRISGVTKEGDAGEHDPDLKLGVVWYYLTGEAPGGDNTEFERLKGCDPALYPKLRELLRPPANRTVANVEKLDFLRVDGRYYREMTPNWGTPNNKPTQRKARLAKADRRLVSRRYRSGSRERISCFLDPDHKITGDKTRIGANSPMFVHVCEIKKLWKLGHSLVIYHQTNNASGMVCRAIEYGTRSRTKRRYRRCCTSIKRDSVSSSSSSPRTSTRPKSESVSTPCSGVPGSSISNAPAQRTRSR